MTSVSHGLGWVVRAGLEVRGQRLLRDVASEEQSVSVSLLTESEENSL